MTEYADEADAGARGRAAVSDAAPYVVTPAIVRRPGALGPGGVPKALLRRGLAIAPRGMPGRPFRRILFEHAPVRYLVALSPFPLAMVIWPDLALPISQAPLLMLLLVLFVESSVLSVGSPAKRRALADGAEVARVLDLLGARGREALVRIAARRGIARGVLHLVVEQSAMARVRPFTLVSVQLGEEETLLDLDAEERALVAGLLGGELSERRLHRINTATDTYLRSVALDARSVSAHARLAAMAARADARRA